MLHWRLTILGRGRPVLTAVLLAPLGAVPVADRLLPAIHLAPVLGVLPAVAAAFVHARRTALIGALATVALAVAAIERSALTTEVVILELSALVLLTTLLVCFCGVRDRRDRELARIRLVSEAAQRVVLPPLPERAGPVAVAASYHAADGDTHLGGDFYALARTRNATRLIIGDVRGKGLDAIGQTAIMVESFHAVAGQELPLAEMVRYMDSSLTWRMPEFSRLERGVDAQFVTLAVAEIPDGQPLVRLILCGHPSPLLLREGTVRSLAVPDPAPPLGLGAIGNDPYHPRTFRYEPGDVLLLHTDGVTETRNAHGTFYPLARRVAAWASCDPVQLVANIESDLRAYGPGELTDDMAMVAVRREAMPAPASLGTPRHLVEDARAA